MNDVTKEVLARIDVLAAKLGVAANLLFSLYVRQAYIDGFETAFLALVFAVSMYFLERTAFKHREQLGDPEFVMPCLGAVILFVLFMFSATDAADHLLNPQLAAFKDIMSTIKN